VDAKNRRRDSWWAFIFPQPEQEETESEDVRLASKGGQKDTIQNPRGFFSF
jgi:hypothetical protein